MQVQPSEVIDGYYACAIPKAYFWRRLWDLRITCGVAAVLCFIISLVVSYLLSSRAYSPIHSMIQRVRSVVEPAERESATDEFEFIANVVETSAKEKAALTNKLRVQVDSEKQRFLLYLMQNAAAGENMGMEELFAQKQIELRSPYFATALIYVESGVGDETSAALSATDVKLLPVAFRNVYTELFENGHLIYLIFLESNQYLLLVNGASQESLQQEWEEQLLLGKTLMERMFHLSFTVAYSEPQEDITGLKVCYQQAAYAKRYRFVKGRGQAIAYRDVAQTTFDYITTSDSKTAQAVQAYLQNPNDTRTAAQVLQEILNLQNITPTSSMETIDCCRFDVVNALNQVMSMNHFVDTERAQRLLACETFRIFRQNAEDCIAALRKDTKLQSEQSKLSKTVKEYIEQHYQDANLNVSALGEAMNLSPAYLSRLFRAEYQVSALDHLYFVRIAAAKELLRSSTRTVSEIAQETGFLSSNVFIKTFKKIEGVTPGAYRSVYQNQ